MLLHDKGDLRNVFYLTLNAVPPYSTVLVVGTRGYGEIH
jgi:hypothetical protein